MTDKLIELIERIQKENPSIIEGLEKLSAKGIQEDKIALYNYLIKDNCKVVEENGKKVIKPFNYDDVDKILRHHENSRLDINWNKGEYIYRVVISRRKREPEKPKKERQVKPSGSKDQPATETKNSAA